MILLTFPNCPSRLLINSGLVPHISQRVYVKFLFGSVYWSLPILLGCCWATSTDDPHKFSLSENFLSPHPRLSHLRRSSLFLKITKNVARGLLDFWRRDPTDALEKFASNPSKAKFRLGGLVLEGSVVQPASSPEIEFVITDLITDMLVRYQWSLPDLFREGHSVVVEGFVKPFTDELRKEVSGKARSGECYFSATEVLAKHDEKYMPQEVAAAIEKNKKTLEAAAAGEEDNEEERSKSS